MPHFRYVSRGPLNAGRALLVGLCLLATPAPAHAGTYQQFACQRPDGSLAPSDGWSATSCRVDLAPPGFSASLSWSESNPELSLVGFSVRRSVSIASAVFRLDSPTDHIRDICDRLTPCESPQVVSAAGLAGGGISLSVECHELACAGPDGATVEAATITLLDDRDPRVGDVGGSLVSGQPVWGVADLTYHASDGGSGIYRQWLIVDGATVVQEVPDSNDGRCRDAMPGAGSDYEFDYVVPCRPEVAGRIAFDLNALVPGSHLVEAIVEDAAGNKRSLYRGQIEVLSDPTRRRFDLGGVAGLSNPLGDRAGYVPNGSGASRTAGLTGLFTRPGNRRALAVTTTFPQMPTIEGRLVNASGPIGGAVVSLLQRVSGTAVWSAVASGRTTADGTVTFEVPRGPSRALRLGYFADSEATRFLSTVPLELQVRPRVTLRATRVRLSGAVRGGRIPVGGLIVRIERSVAGSRWTTIGTARAGLDGRFATSYRRTKARFRAVVPAQAGYPFAVGTSAWLRLQGGAHGGSRRGEFR